MIHTFLKNIFIRLQSFRKVSTIAVKYYLVFGRYLFIFRKYRLHIFSEEFSFNRSERKQSLNYHSKSWLRWCDQYCWVKDINKLDDSITQCVCTLFFPRYLPEYFYQFLFQKYILVFRGRLQFILKSNVTYFYRVQSF